MGITPRCPTICLSLLISLSSILPVLASSAPALQGQVDRSQMELPISENKTQKVTGSLFSDIIFSPDGRTLYVSESGSDCVAAFDTTSMALINLIHVRQPDFLALSPDGTRLYISTSARGAIDGSNEITTVDISTGQTINKILVGNFIVGMELSHDGKTLYIGRQPIENSFPPAIWTIDTASQQVTNRITVPGVGPYEIAYADIHNDDKVFSLSETRVSSTGLFELAINKSHSKLTQILDGSLLSNALRLQVAHDGSKIFALDQDVVHVIDISKKKCIADVPYTPRKTTAWFGPGFAIDPSDTRFYCLDGNKGVSVFNTSNCSKVAEIPLGISADALGLSPDGKCLFAAGEGKLVRVETSDNRQASCDIIGFKSDIQ